MNEAVLDSFLNNQKQNNRPNNFHTDGQSVYSYATEVARKINERTVWVTTIRHSKTTVRQVKRLITFLENHNYKIIFSPEFSKE